MHPPQRSIYNFIKMYVSIEIREILLLLFTCLGLLLAGMHDYQHALPATLSY